MVEFPEVADISLSLLFHFFHSNCLPPVPAGKNFIILSFFTYILHPLHVHKLGLQKKNIFHFCQKAKSCELEIHVRVLGNETCEQINGK